MMEIGKGSSTSIKRSIEKMGAKSVLVLPGWVRPAGVSQGELAEILGLSGPALSIMLGVELSNTVQREIIAKIKEAGR